MLNNYILILAILFTTFSFAQNQEDFDNPFEKQSMYLETTLGLSFHNQTLARINNQVPFDYSLGNSLKFNLTPKFHYAIVDNLFAIGQIGFGYQEFRVEENHSKTKATNYITGAGIKYYFWKIHPKLYLNAETGLQFQYYHSKEPNYLDKTINQSLMKSYLDIGISLFVKENLLFSLVFKDIISYHSRLPNFDGQEGWEINNVFKNLIRYPHFSLAFRLD